MIYIKMGLPKQDLMNVNRNIIDSIKIYKHRKT